MSMKQWWAVAALVFVAACGTELEEPSSACTHQALTAVAPGDRGQCQACHVDGFALEDEGARRALVDTSNELAAGHGGGMTSKCVACHDGTSEP